MLRGTALELCLVALIIITRVQISVSYPSKSEGTLRLSAWNVSGLNASLKKVSSHGGKDDTAVISPFEPEFYHLCRDREC